MPNRKIPWTSTDMLEVIRKSLKVTFDDQIVDELLEAYEDAIRRFYTGDLGPNAVAGGRFSEAAFRLIEEAINGGGNFTPLAESLPPVDRLMSRLATNRANSTTFSNSWQQNSVGLHIPRALRIIYDIRNNRDAAHLADNIDPNKQDASLVVSVLNWVMAELVRLSHDVSADRAQEIVQELVTRKVPVIQEFDGDPKILKPDLDTKENVLILLYYFGAHGARINDLAKSLPTRQRPHLYQVLTSLIEYYTNDVHYHGSTDIYELTIAGIKFVENSKLLDWD